MRALTPSLLMLLSCSSGTLSVKPEPLVLEVTSPTYGEFLGDEDAVVTGFTTPGAVVYIEGREANVGSDGSFHVELDVPRDYRNIQIDAYLVDQQVSERIPVFSGLNPLETYPGAVTARMTPRAFDAIGQSLGRAFDDIGWADQIEEAIPSFGTDTFSFDGVRVTHLPTEVTFVPTDEGLELAMNIPHLSLTFDLSFQLNGDWIELPVRVGYETNRIKILATPVVTGNGFSLELGETELTLDDPDLQVGPIDSGLLDFVLELLAALFEGLGSLILDPLLSLVGLLEIPLISFDTDLLGTQVELEIAEIYTEPDGLALGLGLGLDGPAAQSPLPIPAPAADAGGQRADLALGLHEGLVQVLLEGQVLNLLTQEIELVGFTGAFLELPLRGLDGGHTIPANRGWCLTMDPGSARVVRYREGIEPFAVLSMPDFRFDIGYFPEESDFCTPWLQARLALEVEAGVKDGSELDFSLRVADGVIPFYGTPAEWEEDAVVGDLTTVLEGIVNFAGGFLALDFADLIAIGDLGLPGLEADMRLLDSEPMDDADGETIEGLSAVTMRLFY